MGTTLPTPAPRRASRTRAVLWVPSWAQAQPARNPDSHAICFVRLPFRKWISDNAVPWCCTPREAGGGRNPSRRRHSATLFCLASHDVALQARKCTHDIRPLFFRHVELVQGLCQQLHHLVPICFGDVQSGVCGLHVASGVFAGSSGRYAKKIDNVLANADLGVRTEANEEASQLRIGSEAAKKIVTDSGERIVSPETLIQSLLPLRCLRWRGCVHRHHGRNTQQYEIKKWDQSFHFVLCPGVSFVGGFPPPVCTYGPARQTDVCQIPRRWRGRIGVTGALEGPTSGVVASIVLAGIVRPALAVLILFAPDSTSDF